MNDKEYVKEQFDIAYHSGNDQAFIENMEAFISTYLNVDNEHGKALTHFIETAKETEEIPGMLFGMIHEAFNKLIEEEGAIKSKKKYVVESQEQVYYQHRVEAWTADEAQNIILDGLYEDEEIEFKPYDGDFFEVVSAKTEEELEEEWKEIVRPLIGDEETDKMADFINNQILGDKNE